MELTLQDFVMLAAVAVVGVLAREAIGLMKWAASIIYLSICKVLSSVISLGMGVLYVGKRLREFKRARTIRYLPESTRAGSEYFTTKRLPFMVGVYIVDKDMTNRTYCGTAIRIGDFLVTCAHIIENVPYANLAFSRLDGEKEEFSTGQFIEDTHVIKIAADVVAIRMTALKMQGVKAASIGPIDGKNVVRVVSWHPTNNASIGVMNQDEGVHGGWIYEGSTRKGFSGAPYIYGDRVVGMHIGGGAYNYGMATALLLARLDRKEDTEFETIKAQLRAAMNEQFEWRSAGNPDEMELRINGAYHVVDREDYYKLMQEREEYRAALSEGYQGKRSKYELESQLTKEELTQLLGSFLEEKKLPAAALESLRDGIPETGEEISTDSKNSPVTPSLRLEGLPKNLQMPAADFTESTPADTTLPAKSENQILDTNILEKLDMLIPQNQLQQCSARLENIQLRNYNQVVAMLQSLNVKLEKLHNMPPPNSTSPTECLPCQEKTDGIDGLSTSSPSLNPSHQPDSGASPSTPILATAWDGMANHLRKLTAYYSSNSASNKGFAGSRDKLLKTFGLTTEQKRWLIRTVERTMDQLARETLPPTPSTSS